MKKIKISNRNLYAIVDNKNYKYLSQFKWHMRGDKGGYAHNITIGFMHNVVSKPPVGMIADHKNRDRLDNRARNLRWATKSQNSANRVLEYKNFSGYRGVYPHGNKHRAIVGGEYVGDFETPEEAAKAYNRKAKKKWGKFAILNTIRN